MEGFSGERACYGAVGAYEPEIKAELLGDGKGEGVAAARDEDDFDASGVRLPKGSQIAI
jgi:hypothetical protein